MCNIYKYVYIKTIKYPHSMALLFATYNIRNDKKNFVQLHILCDVFDKDSGK